MLKEVKEYDDAFLFIHSNDEDATDQRSKFRNMGIYSIMVDCNGDWALRVLKADIVDSFRREMVNDKKIFNKIEGNLLTNP